MLLEKAGVPYQVYDRMREVKPLGASLIIGPNVAPIFRQLGIFEDLLAISKESLTSETYTEDGKLEFSADYKPIITMGGSAGYFVSRSDLYDLLLRQVPSDKIHLGKRLLSVQQNEHGVRIQFADSSAVEGDILVGADGAYSGVRQSIYAQLKKNEKLPSSDDVALPFSCICLVGQTKPLDPVKFPELSENYSRVCNTIGNGKPFTWSTVTLKNNIYTWMVTQYLSEETSKENDSFRNSEWGPEAAEAMAKEVRDFPIASSINNGTTLGNLIDETPYVSKIMLEEKLFETWYSGRTVLIGDACHKFLPTSGLGAVNAMHDAIALANWLSVLKSTSIEDAEKTFKEYKEERYPAAVAAFNTGKIVNIVIGADMKGKIARYIVRTMPNFIHKIGLKSAVAQRPQVSFLPHVKDEGSLPPKYQPSLEKTLAIHKANANSTAAQAAVL
ncbi:hypothetical protein EDD11_010197 [Mortierella claussenii]|nr:hypothetical protein EDD11_010197 [Mortierella claussenii]